MASKIKRGDHVIVISGDFKNETGEVLSVLKEEKRVVVKGVALCFRHTKPSARHPEGGRITKERPIHISNVALLDGDKPTRIGFKVRSDGKKVRVAKRSGNEIGG